MGGSSSLWLGSSITLYSGFQFLAWTKRHHPASGNGDLLTGFGISPWSLTLVPEIKVTKAGYFYLLVVFQAVSYLLKEQLDELLRLTLIQTKLFIQPFSHFGLGKRRHPLIP